MSQVLDLRARDERLYVWNEGELEDDMAEVD